MVRFDDLGIFVRSAALGSFTAAAREANLLPDQVAEAVKRLERELDVRLFARTTRSLRLTAEGEQYLPSTLAAVDALKHGRENLRRESAQLRGTLQVAAPSDVGHNVLLPWLTAFRREYPLLNLRFFLSEQVADLCSTSGRGRRGDHLQIVVGRERRCAGRPVGLADAGPSRASDAVEPGVPPSQVVVACGEGLAQLAVQPIRSV